MSLVCEPGPVPSLRARLAEGKLRSRSLAPSSGPARLYPTQCRSLQRRQ